MRTLLQQEEKLNSFTSSYYYTERIYNKLLKKIKFFENDKTILEDLIIELEEGLNLCKSSLNTISNIRNYHSILLSNKMNRTITILTIFTIFFSMSMTIFGFFGMNIELSFKDNANMHIYLIVIVMTIGLSMSTYFWKTRL